MSSSRWIDDEEKTLGSKPSSKTLATKSSSISSCVDVGFNPSSLTLPVPPLPTIEKEKNEGTVTIVSQIPDSKSEDVLGSSSQLAVASPAAPIYELPPKKGSRSYRYLRWNFFSVYRRIFAVVFVINVAIFIGFTTTERTPGHSRFTQSNTLNAAAVNLLVGILMRQEHVINILFLLSSSLPLWTPFLLRKWIAKIYCYGGMHSGCGIAALVWYLGYTGLISNHLASAHVDGAELAVAVMTYLLVLVLVLIVTFAHPTIRNRMHNWFEAVHRFAGYTAIGLIWAQLILIANADGNHNGNGLGRSLIEIPAFWCIVIITCCAVYPWTRLRVRDVRADYLSNHAVRLYFDYATLDYCIGVRITDNPLKETHSFATLPEPNGARGFSVLISNAGDWTKKIISNPPNKLYVKGAPVYGVLRVAVMFSPAVIVTTGSGIGPVMSLLNGRTDLIGRIRILWSTPNPLETYGQKIIDTVKQSDPDAIIIDTRKSGRPDMVALTYQLYRESNSEAIVIISNPKVTRKVVYGMETRGVAAYGAIFDS